MRGIGDLLETHELFRDLAPDTVTLLAGCARNVAFRSHQPLFEEGGRADRFWLIRHGRVAIGVNAPGRGELIVETVGPDAVVGWSWLVPPHRWRFDAIAQQPTRAVEFDVGCVQTKLDSDPRLGYELLSRFLPIVVERLQATRMRLLDLYGSAQNAG